MNKHFKVLLTDTKRIRLDHFLVDNLKLNRTKIQELIKNNFVKINNNLVNKTGFWLENDDLVDVKLELEKADITKNVVLCEKELDVVYEDDDLLVVNKPSGMLTHPTVHEEVDTLVNVVANYFVKNNVKTNLSRLGIVHRLDKHTSGLMLVAKNEEIQKALLNDFANNKILKKYYAIILKQLPKKHLMINLKIGHSTSGTLKMVVNGTKDLKDCKTEVMEVEKLHRHSLVECILHTGRTHQIRVHLSAINLPVLNDYLYGHAINGDDFGQYLHAYYLEFIHPKTKKVLSFNVKWPVEFENKYNYLKYEKINNEC